MEKFDLNRLSEKLKLAKKAKGNKKRQFLKECFTEAVQQVPIEEVNNQLNATAVKAFLLKTKKEFEQNQMQLMSGQFDDVRKWAAKKVEDSNLFSQYPPNQQWGIASNLVLYVLDRPSPFDQYMPQLKEDGSVNELSPATFQSAFHKMNDKNHVRRAEELSKNFFREFVGMPLMGGKITVVGGLDHTGINRENIIVAIKTDKQNPPGVRPGIVSNVVHYDVADDEFDIDRPNSQTEVSRQDIRVLSKIAVKINPNTKYKSGGTHNFKVNFY